MKSGDPEFERELKAHLDSIEKRLRVGAVKYGDRSFSRDPAELIQEILDEVDDIAGWCFPLRVRLVKLQDEARKLNILKTSAVRSRSWWRNLWR